MGSKKVRGEQKKRRGGELRDEDVISMTGPAHSGKLTQAGHAGAAAPTPDRKPCDAWNAMYAVGCYAPRATMSQTDPEVIPRWPPSCLLPWRLWWRLRRGNPESILRTRPSVDAATEPAVSGK